MSTSTPDHLYDAVVVGAGAAGVGVAVALRPAGIENFVVLERHTVGGAGDRLVDAARASGLDISVDRENTRRLSGCAGLPRRFVGPPTL